MIFLPKKKLVFFFPPEKPEMIPAPPPSEHLGLFLRESKNSIFASFATNGNTARVKKLGNQCTRRRSVQWMPFAEIREIEEPFLMGAA